MTRRCLMGTQLHYPGIHRPRLGIHPRLPGVVLTAAEIITTVETSQVLLFITRTEVTIVIETTMVREVITDERGCYDDYPPTSKSRAPPGS